LQRSECSPRAFYATPDTFQGELELYLRLARPENNATMDNNRPIATMRKKFAFSQSPTNSFYDFIADGDNEREKK